VRDLPLLKTPEGSILVSQRPGIRGMSVKTAYAGLSDVGAPWAIEYKRVWIITSSMAASHGKNSAVIL
jgi:hypothetical protein